MRSNEGGCKASCDNLVTRVERYGVIGVVANALAFVI